MQKITPCLWFDGQAEEAANFYTSVFEESEILEMSRYTEGTLGPAGSVLTVSFSLNGHEFTALNGGPQFTFNEAVSFQVSCADQAEVDYLWEALSEGGQESQCGWLKDRFGVSWQIIPKRLPELLSDPDPARAKAAMTTMLAMKKIDVRALEDAADAAAAG